MKILAFEDPDDPRNGPSRHTGEPCIKGGCDRPAGTAWSPYWCFEHNVERLRRIGQQVDAAMAEINRTHWKGGTGTLDQLMAGWADLADDEDVRPSTAVVDRAKDIMVGCEERGIPAPAWGSTPAGGLLGEWEVGKWTVSVEVDPDAMSVYVLSICIGRPLKRQRVQVSAAPRIGSRIAFELSLIYNCIKPVAEHATGP